jgi:putative DNA modification/repair radical SAM protein
VTIQEKLEILADAAKYDASCSSSGSNRKRDKDGFGNTEGMGICHSYTPDGRCVSLLKILLTNFCIYDCKFCINRVSSDTKRARFTVDEVVWLTTQFYRRNYIEGLFLSSGIIDSVDSTMELITEAAKRLREDEKFGGYIHLKVVPGASKEMIERAGLYADRVSANIELPTQPDLDRVATAKKISTALDSMEEIRGQIRERGAPAKIGVGGGTSTRAEARGGESALVTSSTEISPWVSRVKSGVAKERVFAPAGQTTQMLVGATAATDQTILGRTQSLYTGLRLRRVFYSAYSPIPNADASMPVSRPALVRENRLYQADWLLRFYGFKAEELTSGVQPNLALDVDPKTAWALAHREFFPVDVNRATKEQILRIPGIGARNADRLLTLRRHRRVTLEDLRKLRVSLVRAKYFVITADHNPSASKIDALDLKEMLTPAKTRQMSLFDEASKAAIGGDSDDGASAAHEGAASEDPAVIEALTGNRRSAITSLLTKYEPKPQLALVQPTTEDIIAVHTGQL